MSRARVTYHGDGTATIVVDDTVAIRLTADHCAEWALLFAGVGVTLVELDDVGASSQLRFVAAIGCASQRSARVVRKGGAA